MSVADNMALRSFDRAADGERLLAVGRARCARRRAA